MKFAQKITLIIVLLLSVTLSVGGAWTIQQNFAHSRNTILEQDTALHLRERYTLEGEFDRENIQSIADYARAAEKYARRMSAAAGEGSAAFSIFSNTGTPVYSNMPSEVTYMHQWSAVEAGESSIRWEQAGSKNYLVMASPLSGQKLWIVNAYDVTALFTERDRQLRQYLVLEITALVLAGGAAAIISVLLTSPLRRLEMASRKIASGNYASRVQIASRDEVGQLAQAFNSMADAVQQHTRALEQETQRQKRFVAAFTHELKTPMTSILGYADVLRSGEQPAEKRQKAANYIYHESNRLERLSQELLALLGLEHRPPQMEPVSLAAIWGDVRRSLPPEMAERVKICCPAELCVQADRVLAADLLRNLVLNAAAANPVDGKVHVRCQRTRNGCRIQVQDRGRGIAPHELQHVLEPFYRVDKSRARKNGGNGLGLSLCDEIARAHGSSLNIRSRPGKGTSVSITLKEAES